MRLDLIKRVATTTRTHQIVNEIDAFACQFRVVWNLKVLAVVHNLAACLQRILGVEWRIADETLKHDDAHRPPVHHLVIAFLTEHLWRNIVGRSHRRKHQLAVAMLLAFGIIIWGNVFIFERRLHGLKLADHLIVFRVEALGESKIGQLYMTIVGDQNIVRLQIAMHKIQLVHCIDSDRQLRHIKFGLRLAENIVLHEDGHQVTTTTKLHHQIQINLVLK
mmetsp:Transcript_54837/g.90972  ORF Transcript_54837/g.90972 Transcript_54837/m.90972 type:complete len:220 (+) Transcript_54837:536-1195(+)